MLQHLLELSTPTLQRATIAHNRLRMEGWRQRRLGSKARIHKRKNKTVLTLTGLLMEGVGLKWSRPRS